MDSLSIPGVRSLKWVVLSSNQGISRTVFFLDTPVENPVPCPFQLLEATWISWLLIQTENQQHGLAILSDSDPPAFLLQGPLWLCWAYLDCLGSSLWCKVAYLQVLGIRMWTSSQVWEGGVIPSTTRGESDFHRVLTLLNTLYWLGYWEEYFMPC